MLIRIPGPGFFKQLISCILLLALLSACGGAARPGDSASEERAEPARNGADGAPAQSAEPVTLEIFTPVRSVELAPPGEDWIIAKAVKEQLNIDLKMSWQTNLSEYERLVMMRGAANDLPDVFLSSTNLGRDLGAQGLLADWTPLLKHMPTYVEEREVERLAPVGTFDGKLYTLPAKTADPFKQAVVIRQDWLDKLGLETPKTLEEYLEVMHAFAEEDPDGNGQDDTYGWSAAVDSAGKLRYFDPIFGAFGALGDWRVEDNELIYVPTSAARLEALQFIKRMSEEGALDAEWSAQKPADRGNKWKAGKVGIFQEDWCATFCKGNYDPFAEANPTGRLADIAPPVGPNGESANGTHSLISGFRFSISKRAVDAGKGEAIARLMEWLNTDGYYLVSFGEEGKHWEREGEKIVAKQTDAARIVKAFSSWALKGSEAELRARYDQTTTHANGQTVKVWEVEQRAQKFPYVDVTDYAALPVMPSEFAGDLMRIKAEGELQFATGQRPASEWDAYVQSLMDAGLAEWQAQAEQKARELGLLK